MDAQKASIVSNIVNNTKYLAKKNSKKLSEVEETLGVSSGYLSKYLKKGIVPLLQIVLSLAKLFDVSMEILCDVDLTENEIDDACTFVQAHGRCLNGICYDSDGMEQEITAFAEKLMIPKRDLINSVYSCIPVKLRIGETVEECVFNYWGIYKRLLNS